MRFIILYITILCYFASNAQVELESAVKFVGTADSLNTIEGLDFPNGFYYGTNSQVIQVGKLINAKIISVASDSISLLLPINPTGYVEGMEIHLISNTTNSGTVNISINSLPFKTLLYNNRNLDSAEIINGQSLILIYNGINFEMINERNKPCLSGFVSINLKYCIETQEHDSLSFLNAIEFCGNKNARLCSWSEWYVACQDANITLLNMLNNYEWVDDAGNFNNPIVQTKVMGNGTCEITHSHNPQLNRKFRCCYTK